jgi:cell wall-associated NlpC family hydrolase
MDDQPPPLALIPRPGILPMTDAREAELRQRVITEALSWVGTPYRQLGATKGVAVDCSMLLCRVVIDAGIVEEFDPRPYPPAWFIHRDDERYLEWLATMAAPVEAGKPGDVIAFRFGRAYAHSGLIISDTQLVHAFAQEGRCTVSPLHHAALLYAGGMTPRPRRYFDFFARLRGQR